MAKETEKKQKRPTPAKRVLQDEKRESLRTSFHSKTKTAIRTFLQSLKLNEAKDVLQEKLKTVYSLMDKGVKKHVFKQNKAARIKGKMTEKLNKK